MIQYTLDQVFKPMDEAKAVLLKAANEQNSRTDHHRSVLKKDLAVVTEALAHLQAAVKALEDSKFIFTDILTLEHDPKFKERFKDQLPKS